MSEENRKDNDMKYFDTYEAMSKEEQEELILIQKIRTNVKYFIGIENIISQISLYIDQSETVSFASERNRKYISKTEPLFVLKINNKIAKSNGLKYFNETNHEELFISNHLNPVYENDIKSIQSAIQEEIIAKFTTWIMDYLMDDDKFMELCKSNGLSEITLDKEILKLITRTSAVMFAIKVDLKNNKVFLQYAI